MEQVQSCSFKQKNRIMPVFVGDIKIADLLPESTAEDQGKVLTVSESGEPEWSEGGASQSNVIIIDQTGEVSINGETSTNVFEEVAVLVDNKEPVKIVFRDDADALMPYGSLYITTWNTNDGNKYIVMEGVVEYSTGYTLVKVLIQDDNRVAITKYPHNYMWDGTKEQYDELPSHITGVLYLIYEE